MILFVMEDEYTNYLRLYILGHEPFCCVENECTYYLRLYILGHEHFVKEDEYTLFTFIYLRFCIFLSWKMNTHYLRLYSLGHEPFCRGR